MIRQLNDKHQKIDTIDGLSISFEQGGRLLIRASNTGPKIRFSVEAKKKSRVKEIMNEYIPLLENLIKKFN